MARAKSSPPKKGPVTDMPEQVTLSRDAEAVQIPYGEKLILSAGTTATITQSLGGAYTLITDKGQMVRLSGKDVEAIGKEPAAVAKVEGDISKENLEKMVWEQLKTCFDPEIPVNIVDL